ncbi:MAG: flagellin [Verrucomicrobiota bacterium]|nr:flagellin [Verrucomicrobiota bacterium]
MVINTNLAAMTGARLLDTSQRNLTNSLSRLSTGSRIVQPQDDAAGLAVSSRFAAQISRNSAAMNNLANAVSFSQTQDGFTQKVTTALDRMSELTVLAMDITKTNSDRSNYSVEFTQLQNYISDIGTKTFNGVSLFAATGTDVTIDSDGNTFTMNPLDLNSTSATTGLARAFNGATTAIYTTTSAGSALSNIQTAIQNLADMRANVGANIQRLNVTRNQVGLLNEKLSATNSRILDVDVAQETTELARFNILVQSGTTMLTQANLMPQAALQLIA